MIREEDLQCVGKLLKPHGICGEITALLSMDVDLSELSCIFLKLDGIFVPFFLNGVRPKSSETDLLTIDGIDNEVQAAGLCPNDIYALAEELPADGEMAGEGMYASDLKDFRIFNNGEIIGKIIGIDDTTENYLFIVETPSGDSLLIPVADEYIAGLDPENKSLFMELPEGLIGINDK